MSQIFILVFLISFNSDSISSCEDLNTPRKYQKKEIKTKKMTADTKFDVKSGYVQIIDGKPAPTQTSRHGINPANLQALPDVPVATQEDLDRAVEAGKKAFKSWSRVPLEERRKALHAYADAIEELHNDFRDLLVAEGGKPVGLFANAFIAVAISTNDH